MHFPQDQYSTGKGLVLHLCPVCLLCFGHQGFLPALSMLLLHPHWWRDSGGRGGDMTSKRGKNEPWSQSLPNKPAWIHQRLVVTLRMNKPSLRFLPTAPPCSSCYQCEAGRASVCALSTSSSGQTFPFSTSPCPWKEPCHPAGIHQGAGVQQEVFEG